MRAVIQRTLSSSVVLTELQETRTIGQGLVILLGIETEDDNSDAEWLIRKISALRIFGDEEGKMNRSIQDIEGSVLLVSQFTLHASTKKGNRPSFIRAARPEHAIPLYEYFREGLKREGIPVVTGEFGADMKVHLINDGPVTIWMDTKEKE